MTTINTAYEDLLRHVLENGTHKNDRTGTGTTSVFGHQMRFDLTESFPLITTKKVHTKSIVGELIWFLNGDTNVRWLQENGIRIWNEWRRPYSTERKELTLVTPRKAEANTPKYDGVFDPTGRYEKDSVEQKLSKIWSAMMKRCYLESHHRYNQYGALGATVHHRWHDVAAFIEDAPNLPQWWYKQKDWENFELDKDYYGSNQYGPETSVWLHTEENNYYTKTANPVTVIDSEGNGSTYITQAAAARTMNMSTATLSRFLNNGMPTILKGENKLFAGYEFKLSPQEENSLLRLKLIENGDLGPVYGAQWRAWPKPNGETIDQISEALKLIKYNPDSRRIIVSAWNPGILDDQALPACHALFQFYVADGKLSCQLYQRSADLFLGVPFNIASYALLTCMMAQQAGLEPGEFIWTGGDCHIYDNHREQVTEQLSRKPYPFPTLKLNKANTLFDYKIEDVAFENYQHHPMIKAPVAV